MIKRKMTEKTYEKLCEVIPGGVNSPVRACHGVGQIPLVAESAAKDRIYDMDGNAYVDYCGSWGALIHGHAHPDVLRAVRKRLTMGTSFGVTTAVEEQLARKVVDLIDSVEKIRFVSSGTEAAMSVVRLARGFTGRDIVIKFAGNYHGHADSFLMEAGSGVMEMCPASSSAGVPPEMLKHMVSLPYNDIETARKFLRSAKRKDQIAAVILEPIAGNMGVVPATQEFIKMLRTETSKIGALLIFDEVITGFRVGHKGAQSYFGVTPDLTCFGKIIGGGFPAAAFGGRKEIMDHLAPLGPVYQAGTLSGNPVAMEAGLMSLMLLEKKGFYQELERKTQEITEPVKEYMLRKKLNACVQELGSMFTIFFGVKSVSNMDEAKQVDHDRFAKFFKFMFSNGVYIPPSQHEAWFVSSVHEDKNLIKTRDLILEFLKAKSK